jgi:hypothetical protein
VRSRGQAVEEKKRKRTEKKEKGSQTEKERREQRKTRKERQEETRERQGRESHKNDTVESKENTEARSTTPPAQHAFIAIIFVISRESINRRIKRIKTKTGVAIAFAVPRSSNHWLSAEASAPVVFVRLSASFQEKESRTEKKGKRREENREKKRERGKQHRRTPDELRQRRTEKKASLADQVSCLLFPAFACILSCICYCSSEI